MLEYVRKPAVRGRTRRCVVVMLNGDILLELDIVDSPHNSHAVSNTLDAHIYEFFMLQFDEYFPFDLVLCRLCQLISPGGVTNV